MHFLRRLYFYVLLESWGCMDVFFVFLLCFCRGEGESVPFFFLLSFLFFCSLSLVDSDDLLIIEHCSIYTTDEMSQGDERG